MERLERCFHRPPSLYDGHPETHVRPKKESLNKGPGSISGLSSVMYLGQGSSDLRLPFVPRSYATRVPLRTNSCHDTGPSPTRPPRVRRPEVVTKGLAGVGADMTSNCGPGQGPLRDKRQPGSLGPLGPTVLYHCYLPNKVFGPGTDRRPKGSGLVYS